MFCNLINLIFEYNQTKNTKNMKKSELEKEIKELKDDLRNKEYYLKDYSRQLDYNAKQIENLKLHLKLTEETLQDYREIANRLIK